jgi:hypothetical protein
MNKTHSRRRLPCGCTELRYVFGRELVRSPSCWEQHGSWSKVWGTRKVRAANEEGTE